MKRIFAALLLTSPFLASPAFADQTGNGANQSPIDELTIADTKAPDTPADNDAINTEEVALSGNDDDKRAVSPDLDKSGVDATTTGSEPKGD